MYFVKKPSVFNVLLENRYPEVPWNIAKTNSVILQISLVRKTDT